MFNFSNFNILGSLISHLIGTKPAQELEQKAAPVLVPLEALATQALQNEIGSVLSHNKAFAVQNIAKGLDMLHVPDEARPLVEAVIAQGIAGIGVNLAPAGSAGAGAAAPLEQGASR